MTALVQRPDAPAELSATDASAMDWTAEPAELSQPGLPVGADDQPRAILRTDAEIEAEIRGYLRRGLRVEDSAVSVRVTDGLVLLTGELARQLFVHRLLERVNGISGVVSVTNRLTARHNDAVLPFAWGFAI